VKDALDGAEKLAPDDFEVLWRIARYHFWTADAPGIDSEEKSRQGKLGWDYGDRAANARPERVEGWFYGASGVGQYSLGISVVTALFRGMESKYTERLSRAQSIDASLNGYAADVAWGRYWFELPWPKYDSEKSEEAYRRALRANPNNLRAKVYLAELYLKEDRPKEAASLVAEVLAARPGAYDAPEERRAQQEARALLPKLER
jgi:tetratricopeptide (TPR) repeat protein